MARVPCSEWGAKEMRPRTRANLARFWSGDWRIELTGYAESLFHAGGHEALERVRRRAWRRYRKAPRSSEASRAWDAVIYMLEREIERERQRIDDSHVAGIQLPRQPKAK
jgi:hypothetical protein